MIEAIVLLLMWVFADLEADRDYSSISIGSRIDKLERWVTRALVCCSAVLLCDAMMGCSWWMAVAGGALFNMRFRWRLNRLRGLEWWYLSPSSWHDYGYLRLFFGRYTRKEMKEDWFILRFSQDAVRAGRLSYAVDGAVMALGLLLAL